MKIWEIMETASAGGSSAGSIAAVANPGATAKKRKNKNGTVKNALDTNDNLMGGAAVKR
jgi:hypothetical protein|tara:strand:- start:12512 stop:12688 length:177 start_codon:yes stop_codon:yes gene_type:complete